MQSRRSEVLVISSRLIPAHWYDWLVNYSRQLLSRIHPDFPIPDTLANVGVLWQPFQPWVGSLGKQEVCVKNIEGWKYATSASHDLS